MYIFVVLLLELLVLQIGTKLNKICINFQSIFILVNSLWVISLPNDLRIKRTRTTEQGRQILNSNDNELHQETSTVMKVL